MGAIDFSINEKLLGFFQSNLNLKWFFETGTFEGASLDLASRHFPRCISVELSQAYYDKAVARFRGAKGIELHCGPSPEILKQVVPSLQNEPGLFWLDAHWCAAEDSAGADSQSPLAGELSAIAKLHPQSVLLIDDARLYLCVPPKPHRYQDWPGLTQIIRTLNTLSDSHSFSVYNDVIAFYPNSIAKEFDRFAYENGVDWNHIAHTSREYKRRRNTFWRRLFR